MSRAGEVTRGNGQPSESGDGLRCHDQLTGQEQGEAGNGDDSGHEPEGDQKPGTVHVAEPRRSRFVRPTR
jgi:hypothetical protein